MVPSSLRRRWRPALHEIIFEADTPAGKAFDLLLILAILLSVATVMLDSVAPIRDRHAGLLVAIEWTFTALFTVEYALRLLAVEQPRRYALSFFGIVDLLAVLPTYLSLVVAGGHYLLVIRTVRMLRIFRVLKLAQYVGEAEHLNEALRASRRKITVFLLAVMNIVLVVGALMYVVEGGGNGFDSIPRSVYWAIVTLTTVGYGDISPQTMLGQALASVVMILGYAIIAVPTGIVTSELTAGRYRDAGVSTQACPGCGAEGHDVDARFCRRCGHGL